MQGRGPGQLRVRDCAAAAQEGFAVLPLEILPHLGFFLFVCVLFSFVCWGRVCLKLFHSVPAPENCRRKALKEILYFSLNSLGQQFTKATKT